MVKMDDFRKVGRSALFFSLDGKGPDSVKNLEAEKQLRLNEPTGRDVFRCLRHELEQRPGDESMVVNLEAGRLIAFRIEAGDKEVEWQRVPPVAGWKDKDPKNGYYYFFAIEPEIGWGDMLYRSFKLSEGLKDKYQKPGDYIGLLVQTSGSSEDYRLNKKDKESEFRVVRCGFTREIENKHFENAFKNPTVEVGGNVLWAEDGIWLSIGGKNVNVYFNWPDTVEGDIPQLKPITDVKNRMALMTIGGDFLPYSYRESKERWNNFSQLGQRLLIELRHDDSLVEPSVIDLLEKLIQPELINSWFTLDGSMSKLPAEVTLEIGNELQLNNLLHDTAATIYRGLRTGDGHYQLGNWLFELILNDVDGDGDLCEIGGLSVTNTSVGGVELILTNAKTETVNRNLMPAIIQEIEQLKVSKAILRRV